MNIKTSETPLFRSSCRNREPFAASCLRVTKKWGPLSRRKKTELSEILPAANTWVSNKFWTVERREEWNVVQRSNTERIYTKEMRSKSWLWGNQSNESRHPVVDISISLSANRPFRKLAVHGWLSKHSACGSNRNGIECKISSSVN